MNEDASYRAPLKLVVIIGSARENRFAPVVADWTLAQLRQREDYLVEVIDLLDTPLPATFPSSPPAEVIEFRRRIAGADAFLIITPEYNHSFPGTLKIAIDSAYSEWSGKAAALVSYGGLSGGLRAAEHLRQVFAELNVFAVRNTLSFHDANHQFTSEGAPIDASAKLRGATALFDQLAWWGRASRHARREA